MPPAAAGQRSDRGGAEPTGGTPLEGRRPRLRGSAAWVLVGAVLVPLLLGLLWLFFAIRTVEAQATRLSYQAQAVADTRYYDEVLTMSALMAAYSGDRAWIDRYRRAEADLAESLSVALSEARDDELTELLATNAANDALVALERQALDAAEAGDLDRARAILEGPEYAGQKEAYARSVASAAALNRGFAERDVRTWLILLSAQFILLLLGVLLIGLLAWRLLSGTRRWARGEIASRDEDLRAQEDRFARAMHEAAVGMCMVAPDGRFLEVNAALCSMFAMPAERLATLRWQDLTGAEEREVFVKEVERLRAGEVDHFHLVTSFTLPDDGRSVVAYAGVSGIRSRDGGLDYMVCQVVDQTAQAKAEAELVASERRFRLLAENATDLVCETAADGTVVWVAPTIPSALGWSADDLLGLRLQDVLHPDDVSVVEPGETPDPAGGAPAPVPARGRLRTDSGGYRWVTVHRSDLVDASGRPTGAVVGIEDIDDLVAAREQAEAAQRSAEAAQRAAEAAQEDAQRAWAEEERTRVSMESAAIGMAITDEAGRFTDVNPALLTMLGFTRLELTGLTMAAITHPDDADAAAGDLADLVAGTADSVTRRLRYRTRRDDYIWVDAATAAVRSPNGRLQHVVTQVVDVTPEVTNFEALQRSMQQYRLLAENASDVVYQTDTAGIIRWISPSVATVLGWDPEVLCGTRATALVAPEDLPSVNRNRADVYAGHAHQSIVTRFRTADGAYRQMSVSAGPVRDTDGIIVGAVVSLRDVTDEHAAQVTLAERERQYRMLAENSSDVVYQTDNAGTIRWISPSVSTVLGWEADALVGTAAIDLVHPHERATAAERRDAVHAGESRGGQVTRFRTSSGSYRFMSVSAHPALVDGTVTGGIVALRDVTERELAARQLADSEARYRLLAEKAADVVYRLSPDGTIEWVSEGASALIGVAPMDLLLRPVSGIVHPDDRALVAAAAPDILGGSLDTVRCRLLTAGGESRWVEATVHAVRDEDGVPISIVGGIRDVTDDVVTTMELDARARTDDLTGLLNRGELVRQTQELLDRPWPDGHVAVAFCDLDYFKDVNDTHGHAVGDVVLRTTAERIRSCIRGGDLAARLGGDEMVVVLIGIRTLDQALLVAGKLRAAVAEPIPIPGGGDVSVTASIGVTVPTRATGIETLITQADDAMYQAKAAGRDQVVAFVAD